MTDYLPPMHIEFWQTFAAADAARRAQFPVYADPVHARAEFARAMKPDVKTYALRLWNGWPERDALIEIGLLGMLAWQFGRGAGLTEIQCRDSARELLVQEAGRLDNIMWQTMLAMRQEALQCRRAGGDAHATAKAAANAARRATRRPPPSYVSDAAAWALREHKFERAAKREAALP